MRARARPWGLWFLAAAVAGLPYAAAAGAQGPEETMSFAHLPLTRYQAPDLLSYDELVALSEDPYPEGPLAKKIERLFTTPFLSNEATLAGAKPRRPVDPRIGPFLRVVSWNIEKSMNLKEAIAAFKDPAAYAQLIDTQRFAPDSPGYLEALRQRDLLPDADVLLLQEMDMGMKRSEYRDAVREIAEALGMNYVYGASQLEIDPVNLGIEKFIQDDGTSDQELLELTRVDPARYKGVFGEAILSRYPIVRAEVFQLKTQVYDWYYSERESLSVLEEGKRLGAREVFLEKLFREMKVGGRIFLRADLYVPDLPEKTLTVINAHLEIKCKPEGRERQTREILRYIRGVRNPVILAGDFNLASGDISPTSIKREARNLATSSQFWFSQALRAATPQGLVLDVTRTFSNITKNFQNPTARHIPLLAPNRLRKFFDMIEDFEFDDGTRFDFRGDRERSASGEDGTLANSNQKDLAGFKMTFSTDRTIAKVLGKQRLDWVFVKSYLRDPRDRKGPYRFAPHFGRSLEEMNDHLRERISDHHANVVDLPFAEPDAALLRGKE